MPILPSRSVLWLLPAAFAAASLAAEPPTAASAPIDPAAAAQAAEVWKAAGRDRGLCVQLAGDHKLAAALHGQGRWLVALYSPDAAAVAAARQYLQPLGVYGPVSAERVSLAELPPAENLANLVVIDDPARAAKAGISAAEVIRVLAPNGAALVRSGPGADELAKALKAAGGTEPAASGGWLRVTKPRPAAHDDWTHQGYAADNCRVSRDKAVGPPERLQWLAGPVFPVAGDYYYALILSAGGRNFYVLSTSQSTLPTFAGPAVADDPAAGLPQAKAAGTWLLARDAHNGLPLWRRPFDGSAGTTMADGSRLYAMVGGTAAAIDAETGKVVASYGKAEFNIHYSRFMLKDGLLVMPGGKDMRAVDVRTGKDAWKAPLPAKAQVLVEGSLVIVFDPQAKSLAALELATGKEAWKSDGSAWVKGKDRLLFGREGLLVFDAEADKAKHVAGVATKDGKLLWTYQYEMPAGFARWTVLYAGGLVWVQKWMVPGGNNQQWEGLDPVTGKSTRTLTAGRTSQYGCHPEIATDRHVVFNRPADFMSLADGSVSRFRSSRPACQYGATLANGLFYSAPNVCLCVQGVIHGFVGLAPAAADGKPKGEPKPESRLETGPAFGKAGDAAAPAGSDWPTFRHDPARSSSTAGEKFPPKLKVLWKTPVAGSRAPSLLADDASGNWTGGEPLTAPTVAGGRVFVALPDRHQVVALDAAGGKPVWSATVGGRTDVPPTIHGGLALVGARDGWVYALGASDGQLAWRFRAAPEERRVVAFGQLESAWPVVGGVLVRDNLAYACSGRSSESDGGTGVCCLEPASGKLLWETRPPGDGKVFVGLADLLVADGRCVSVGGSTHFRADPKTGKVLGREIVDGVRAGTTNGQYYGYIGSASTLLDRSWHYSGSGNVFGRFQTQWRDGLTGQLAVCDKTRVVAAQRKTVNKQMVSGIVAQNRPAKPGEKVAPLWSVDLPAAQGAEALVIAGECLLVGTASLDRKAGAVLVLSMKDGAKLGECELPGAVAAEGLAVVGESVYVTTWSGDALRLGPAE
jgi:outer membrane protein assembly factor BamB